LTDHFSNSVEKPIPPVEGVNKGPVIFQSLINPPGPDIFDGQSLYAPPASPSDSINNNGLRKSDQGPSERPTNAGYDFYDTVTKMEPIILQENSNTNYQSNSPQFSPYDQHAKGSKYYNLNRQDGAGQYVGSNQNSNPGGNPNSGNQYAANPNSGNQFLSNQNSGNQYSGNPYTGNQYTGNPNSGIQYSGNPITGNQYVGNPNSGNQYLGNPNMGNQNIGNPNLGNQYAGNLNTGNQYAGNSNTGNQYAGNPNTGNQYGGNQYEGSSQNNNQPGSSINLNTLNSYTSMGASSNQNYVNLQGAAYPSPNVPYSYSEGKIICLTGDTHN
jgi:hypothetical protein